MGVCVACKKECEDGFALGRLCYQCIEETVLAHISQKGKVKRNEFMGLQIKNYYCNGYFGRDFNLEDAIILENTETTLTVRKTNGQIVQADIKECDMRSYVEEWTTITGYDE